MSELDLPDFDPKATRKAVRRGLVKTASLVLAGLLALTLVLVVAPILVQKSGGRVDRIHDVYGTAFKMYNPSYRIELGECCDTTPWSASLPLTASQLRAYGGFYGKAEVPYKITTNLFGGLEHLPLGNEANTAVATALSRVGHKSPIDKDEARRILAELPKGMRVLALVEFNRPATAEQLVAFGKAYDGCPEKIVYEARPGSVPITFGSGLWDRTPVRPESGWCHENPSGILAEFRSWDKILQDSDAADLRAFDLTLERVRKAAKDGLAYAYLDQGVPVDRLRKLLEDPRVRAVGLIDATFDIARF
ncbi:hypothetical protein ACIBKY_02670 [Nonomuraea sp. NPDC050394]|uniref:hypothetical protein n=1 Tax=Nonomuraea sp. NPDC050394 TaxID=3364363 RepID=UPI00379F893E